MGWKKLLIYLASVLAVYLSSLFLLAWAEKHQIQISLSMFILMGVVIGALFFWIVIRFMNLRISRRIQLTCLVLWVAFLTVFFHWDQREDSSPKVSTTESGQRN